MSRGQLKCIGTPQHLKSRFGQGYKIDIVVEEDKKTVANGFVLSLVPNAALVATNGCYMSYQTPKDVKLSVVRLSTPSSNSNSTLRSLEEWKSGERIMGY